MDKTGYVPLEMYQEMVSGEKDMRRKIQEMYSDLKEELAAKKDYIRHLEEEIEKCHAPVSDIANRGFEKIVRDTEWMDQDDYYLLYSLRESNRRFRNRKS